MTASAARRRPLLGSFVTLVAVFFSTWTGLRVFGSGIADILLVLALLIVLVEYAFRRREIILSWWMLAPTWAALICWGVGDIVSSPRNDNPQLRAVMLSLGVDDESGLLFVGRIAIAMSLVAILIGSDVRSLGRPHAIRLLRVWALGATISAGIAILEYMGLGQFSEYSERAAFGGRSYGLAFHPNSLAQSLALTLPIVIFFLSRPQILLTRALWILVATIDMWGLILADSRGGLIAGSVGLVLAIAMNWRAGYLWLVSAVPVLIAGVIGISWLLENTRVGGGDGADQSDAVRWVLLRFGLETFAENPLFGAGIGNGSGVMVPMVLASSGGLLLLICYYWFILPHFARLRHELHDRFAASCAVSIAVLLLIGLFNNSINERYDFVAVAVAAALLALKKTRGSVDGKVNERAEHLATSQRMR